MRKLLIATIAAAALAAAFGVAAETPQKPSTQQGETMHFKELDRSGDMKLTRDELPADHELLLGYERYDANADGEISEFEFGEYLKGMPE